jgi:AAA+ ATPase superfamily predicted ATPase
MFMGRKTELEDLERFYKKGGFQFAVVYGRRRVGKTTLIHKFREIKKSIYFVAVESTARENLALFSKQILSVLSPEAPKNPFSSFAEAFEYCFKAARRERFVLAVDEYPYLAESDKSVSSVLQAAIDANKDASKLFLILCGSSMSFMENQVLGYKSPLYGRRTSQFKIKPFDYRECARMFPAFRVEDKITLYGVTGGIPEYASQIDNRLSLAENLETLFFNPSGRFFEEPSNLLKQELKMPQTYNGIITAIAGGAAKLNDIASKVGIETSQCSNMLSSLMSLGIVTREYPVGDNQKRRTIYRLADFMFRFWYRFVLPDISRLSMGLGNKVCREVLDGKIESYTGYVFEECAKQFLWREAGRRYEFTELGRWWGSNPVLKQEEEIDILAINGKEALFGECKWRKALTSIDTLKDLIRKSELFKDFAVKRYVLFSKSGFTAGLRKAAMERGDVDLSGLKDMF